MTKSSPTRILLILAITLTLVFWPLGLLLYNRPADVLSYALPALLMALSFILFKLKPRLWLIPLLFIPVFEPKLALLPFFSAGLNLFFNRNRIGLFFLAAALLIALFSFRPFLSQSVFAPDYNARQTILRQTYLYPTTWMARLFQNKPAIPWNKAKFNFFALSDPNNYFFAFHPREITVDNQNLAKFPFLALGFFLPGLLFLRQSPNLIFVAVTGSAGILSLSLLQNFDRRDFLLYPILLLILWSGLTYLRRKHPGWELPAYLAFSVFSITELLRVLTWI